MPSFLEINTLSHSVVFSTVANNQSFKFGLSDTSEATRFLQVVELNLCPYAGMGDLAIFLFVQLVGMKSWADI